MEKKLTFQRLSWLKIASGAIVFVQFKKSLKNIFCSNSILTFLSQNWQHNPWIRIYIGLKFGSGSNLYCTGYSLTIIQYPLPRNMSRSDHRVSYMCHLSASRLMGVVGDGHHNVQHGGGGFPVCFSLGCGSSVNARENTIFGIKFYSSSCTVI